MRNVIERLIDDFHERELPDLLARDQRFRRTARKATVVVGMRRSGKTWFCFQEMKARLAEGIEKERLLYFNFEDERLLPFEVANFQLILETYYRKYPDLKTQRCYLFLDEIQRIEGWETFVRRILDTERLWVCVTGSSSKLLSSEIATSLRGRSITTEMYPFSFREFIRYHGVDVTKIRYGSKTRARLQNLMQKYLRAGGFPEVQTYDRELRREVLRNYLDVVILRDVVERHSVSNTVALRGLIRHVMAAPTARFSVNKFYNTLRSRGIRCTKNNLYGYLDHLADAFFLHFAPLHSRSEKARAVNPRKVYVVDPGLLDVTSFHITEDRGAVLENTVFMHLRRQGYAPEYYVTADGGEVDFVVNPLYRKGRQLIQACWELSDDQTRRREINYDSQSGYCVCPTQKADTAN